MRTSEDIVDSSNDATTDRLVLGVLAGRDTVDAVLGITVRAHVEGYDVLVVLPPGVDPSVVDSAASAGAEILRLPENRSSVGTPRDLLGTVARKRGYPSVVFVRAADSPPDLERSAALAVESDEYAVDAVEGHGVSRDSVVVGVPAFNEAETIGPVVRAVSEHADAVLVVDDGSTDDTVQRAREAGAWVVTHEQNRGYGAALKRIFDITNQWQIDKLVVVDGDGQHDPGDIPHLLKRLDDGHNVVIGSRFASETSSTVPLLRRVGLVVINTLTNIVLQSLNGQRWLSDTQSGFRGYDSAAIECLTEGDRLGDGMAISIDSLFRLSQTDMTICEIATEIDYDVENASTHHPVVHGTALVNNLIRIVETERPITFVGVPGFVSLLVGLGFGYWTVIDYIRTPDFALGLSVTATFFTLLGVFMVFTGIILHALNGQRAGR